MSRLVLSYRPANWIDVVAQPVPVATLRNMVAKGPVQPVHVFHGPRGTGKCLGLGTPVLMFDGTVRPVEQIKAGDRLMGPDSSPRTVLSTTEGTGPLYRITPVKGDPWVCNDVHVLSLQRASGKIVDIPLSDYLRKSNTFKNLYRQFRTGVEFEQKARLSVDPYFLGVWYGDGSRSLCKAGSHTGQIVAVAVSKPDPEILAAVQETAVKWGLQVKTYYGTGSCPTFRLTCVLGEKNPLLTAMRSIVGDCDYLPFAYLTASRADRLSFLAGLLDTDGHLAGPNSFEIVQKRKRVAEDICFLARSLGFSAYLTKKRVNGGDYWRVSLCGDTADIPLRIARKQAIVRRQIKSVLRTGFTAEALGSGSYFGFELDGDGRFLLGDFTVTHNTTCARILTAALNCDRQDGNTCGVCDPCVRLATGRSTALVEMDAASNGLVADMRRIREEVQIATSDRYRVYVLDEAHSMSRQAWDACLKVLEEPPPGIVFVFCTTETEKIPATILSRAFSFTFQRIGIEAIVKRLDRIVTEQKIEISPEVVTAIAQQADGGMRDAISLLEQLMALSSGPIDSEAFDWAVGQVSFGKVLRIASALLARDIQTIFLSVESAANDVSDLAVLAGQLVDLFQLVVQIKTQTLPAGRLAADRLAAVTALSGQIGLDRIIETQSRLLALYEQTRRTRLSQQTILVAGLLRLLGPGLDPAPVAPATAPPPIVKAQSAQPFLSAAEVAAAFGGRIVER